MRAFFVGSNMGPGPKTRSQGGYCRTNGFLFFFLSRVATSGNSKTVSFCLQALLLKARPCPEHNTEDLDRGQPCRIIETTAKMKEIVEEGRPVTEVL
jgi:hypothetical protein